MPDCLYRKEGDHFVATTLSGSPWQKGFQHGGPVCGLLAHAAEECVTDPELQAARLTVDLFRKVPVSALRAETRILREGRRIAVVEVSLKAESLEVARASALFLRRPVSRDLPDREPGHHGPEAFPITPLVPESVTLYVPEGFHTHVEVRWEEPPPSEEPRFWVRAPASLLEGGDWTPFTRAAAMSDLSNALASSRIRFSDGAPRTFINTDSTLYLSRLPVGEWIRHSCDQIDERDGVGLVSVVHHDERGRFGRTVQARLENPARS